MISRAPDEGSGRRSREGADWLAIHEARARVMAAISPLAAEPCPLPESRERVLAGDLTSPIDLPPWTNSAMDGFAVHSADVIGASRNTPVDLPIAFDIAAGTFADGPLPKGAAARIMTGAPVPEGADTVIRIEHTDGGRMDAPGVNRVRILDDRDAGRNLRYRGEELSRGSVGVPMGSVMNAASIGVAASLGFGSVPVIRRPLVALLTSGDELVELTEFEEVLSGRKIVSSNGHTLRAQLEEAGCLVRYLGIARDSPGSLRDALEGAAGADALITSAGISVGDHDHVRAVLEDLDADIRFWRVRMRPGSPFAFGRIGALGSIPWFGLPGNPVSSMVTFELFVRPALLRMSGRTAIFPRTFPVRLLDDYPAPPGLTHFPRVRLETDDAGDWQARLTGRQGSGILSSVAAAHGLLVIPADRPGGRPGETFPVIPLGPSPLAEIPGY